MVNMPQILKDLSKTFQELYKYLMNNFIQHSLEKLMNKIILSQS